MTTNKYYIEDKDFITGYLVGRTEVHSNEDLSNDCIDEIADVVYEDNLDLDDARAIMDNYEHIYFGDSAPSSASYEEIVNNPLFITGYEIGYSEAEFAEDASANDITTIYKDIEAMKPRFERIREGCKIAHCEDDCCDCKDDDSCDYESCAECNYDDLEDYLDEVTCHDIKKVIFSGKATIILWDDGDKTVVKCQKGDKYDPEKGLVMALLKHLLGNDNTFNDLINGAMKKAVFVDESKKDTKPKKKVNLGAKNE